ncbi:hypothetical protein DSM106972_097250 [Dulcicalothrix desertica PCC 7102]|uniref:Uncharacterized protein n=1 Tax=Dulcicalothrix desertica PCC 7102 TaxID=232991 RepID=A0A433UH26_9CYAN|nr:hypothetical protein [Dulcicalothrix desertica]RUS93131.1 hypothetical protein DSM106972_097250 [Dulcicalothrix desertica PCC 7102]TWH62784.1 hypothetical protein CAL7102_00311 [Dulcicalothrix desertica PCC 7102]
MSKYWVFMEMAQRITITLSDELYNRLQIVKDNFNVSRLCQQAIDSAVQMEEFKARTDISPTEKAMTRLRQEKKQAAERWNEIGFNDGVKEAAENLSYKELKYIGEGGDINELISNIEPPLIMYIEHMCETNGYDDRQDFELDIYVAAWVKGACHVWNEIKDKI